MHEFQVKSLMKHILWKQLFAVVSLQILIKTLIIDEEQRYTNCNNYD